MHFCPFLERKGGETANEEVSMGSKLCEYHGQYWIRTSDPLSVNEAVASLASNSISLPGLARSVKNESFQRPRKAGREMLPALYACFGLSHTRLDWRANSASKTYCCSISSLANGNPQMPAWNCSSCLTTNPNAWVSATL